MTQQDVSILTAQIVPESEILGYDILINCDPWIWQGYETIRRLVTITGG